jgi:hypothetical protein
MIDDHGGGGLMETIVKGMDGLLISSMDALRFHCEV